MPGRPKKPLILHRIEGTGRKCRIEKRKNELQLDPTVPECPDWLWLEAKEEWKRLVSDSRYAVALSNVDRGMIALYCQLWARFVKGEQEDNPIGGRQLQTLVATAAKLGLNPVDRTKVPVVQPEKPDSPWAKLANNR